MLKNLDFQLHADTLSDSVAFYFLVSTEYCVEPFVRSFLGGNLIHEITVTAILNIHHCF